MRCHLYPADELNDWRRHARDERPIILTLVRKVVMSHANNFNHGPKGNYEPLNYQLITPD